MTAPILHQQSRRVMQPAVAFSNALLCGDGDWVALSRKEDPSPILNPPGQLWERIAEGDKR